MTFLCQKAYGDATSGSLLARRMGILIPAYNESSHLLELLQSCRAIQPAMILVVDDGSNDATPEVLAAVARDQTFSIPVDYLRNARNLGKQGAVRRGLELLGHEQLDAVALIDGDGQHDPGELPRLVSLLQTHDVVIGVRSQEQMPLQRRFANWLVNQTFSLIAGIDFGDVQSGLRLYRQPLVRVLAERLPSLGAFGLEHESLAVLAEYAKEQGKVLNLAAAPISCCYGKSKSKIRPRDVMQLAQQTVRQASRIRSIGRQPKLAEALR